jgi:dihydropyrimidinase
MTTLDLVIRNGTVVTATDRMDCDVGVSGGKIVALGTALGPAAEEIDAAGRLVLPGGIDSHVHIEQKSSMGIATADDFYSGTVAAAFGGTTTIIPFAVQERGRPLRQSINDYHALAAPKAVIDYAFHLIILDPSEQVLGQELPALIKDGYTSFKVYMTYDRLRLDDYQLLSVLALAKQHGAMAMIHAENHEIIRWLTEKLLTAGNTAPLFHAVSHPRIAEAEATERALRLSELLDVPLLIVHMSEISAINAVRAAQTRGLRVYGETCPQYLFLTAQDLDRHGLDGAKFCCSPPPRDAEAQQAVWAGLRNGTFQVFSSDHAPYRFDESGKLPKGAATRFSEVANGVPGIELRLPLLFSEGVAKGRIDLNQFVALTATNHAKLYGLYPRKGTIAIGSDADLALWNPARAVTVSAGMLHDRVGYTPYEARTITGWPEIVLSRGRVVAADGALKASRGSGEFLPCGLPEPARPIGRLSPELALLARRGTPFA